MIEECHIAVNKIASKHLDIMSLQSTVITLLDNLEVWWLALSSLVLDDQPLEYLTGKIQTVFSETLTDVLLPGHYLTSPIYDSTCMVQLVAFINVWFIGIIGGSQAHGDFFIAILSMGFYWVYQLLNGTPMDIWHQATITDMPSNIRDALLQFDIESKMVIYAICPTCHFIYAPQFTLNTQPIVHITLLQNQVNVDSHCIDTTNLTHTNPNQ